MDTDDHDDRDSIDTELGKIVEAYRLLGSVDVDSLDQDAATRVTKMHEELDPVIHEALLDGRIDAVAEVSQ